MRKVTRARCGRYDHIIQQRSITSCTRYDSDDMLCTLIDIVPMKRFDDHERVEDYNSMPYIVSHYVNADSVLVVLSADGCMHAYVTCQPDARDIFVQI